MINNFTFNGIQKDYVAYKDYTSHWSQERDVAVKEVKGRTVSLLDDISIKPRTIEVELDVNYRESPFTREEVIDDINAWLVTDEPKPINFAREPNKLYYGMITGAIEPTDFVGFSSLKVTFICLDPYKYSVKQYKNTAISDSISLQNAGTAPTYPIIQARALKDSTSFLISKNDEDYFMVGQSMDAFKKSINKNPRLFYTTFDNVAGWQYVANGTNIQASDASGTASGKFKLATGTANKPYAIMPDDYGERATSGWHGPTMKRSLPRSVDNFNVRIELKMWSRREGVGKGYMFLYDERGNIFAAIGLLDAKNSKTFVRAHFILFNEYGDRWEWYDNAWNWAYDNALVNLEIRRRDNHWRIKTWHYTEDEKTKKKYLTSRMTKFFNDKAQKYTQRLAQVGVSTMKHSSYNPLPVYFNTMIVNEELPDTDDIPLLIKEGDDIHIDMKENLVMINNEPVLEEKDFGSDFFEVSKGFTEMFISPTNTFDTSAYWQDRYL